MKATLITGANKGIGFETAKQLLKDGYFVSIGGINLENGKFISEKYNPVTGKLFGNKFCNFVRLNTQNTNILSVLSHSYKV